MNRSENLVGGCVGAPIRDVIAQSRGEERILLQRDREHPAPRREIEVSSHDCRAGYGLPWDRRISR